MWRSATSLSRAENAYPTSDSTAIARERKFNSNANETCYLALDDLLTYVGSNPDVWMGWAVWAGGPWWGENILTVQPRADGKDRPQMTVLKRHLPTE